MKGKLINKQTKEEHLCDKITIDGFDYYIDYTQPIEAGKWYISNQAPRLCVKIKESPYPYIHLSSKGEEIADFHTWRGIIICTNNPNIDIPQVVDEVYIMSKSLYPSSPQKAKHFIAGHTKSQETHPFSEEDMIEFNEWCETSVEANLFWRRNRIDPKMSGSHHKIRKQKRKELLQLWKEQQPKKVYYEK